MIVLAIAAAALLLQMFVVALWNLVAAARLERAPDPPSFPRVSLLIPARNEADNLRRTLPTLLATDHPSLEILVLDDGSEDDTAAVVEALADDEAEGRLRLLRGRPLPAGWLGKCWACHQLAEEAAGEWLIFVDADVSVAPGAVRRTLGAAAAAGAEVVTALPRQRLPGWAEAAVVPLVAQLSVLALLPLALVPRLRAPSLAMGNGQWLAFTRAAYDRCGGHEAVRATIVEDVALARRAKASGSRLLPLLAPHAITVGMYRGLREVREGFGKNLYALCGGRPASLGAALVVFLLVAVYPWAGVLLGAPGALPSFLLLVGVRVCGWAAVRHGPASVFLHPLGSLVTAFIAVDSFRRSRRGDVVWKGRRLVPEQAR
jgi:chlorobactene glucosyltransferase